MKIAILRSPDSMLVNDLMQAVARAGMEPVAFLWDEAPDKLGEMAGYVIVDGFSYGNSVNAGVVRAIKTQSALGKPVLGINEGVNVLVETGLVPGLEDQVVGIALASGVNPVVEKETFSYIRLSEQYQRNAFTQHLAAATVFAVPAPKKENYFEIPVALLQEMEVHGLNIFQYCDADGKCMNQSNGIAAVSNKAGNVLAMIPSIVGIPLGDAIFQSLREYAADELAQQRAQQIKPLDYYPRK